MKESHPPSTPSTSPKNQRYLFVGGAPRSGTTLISNLLDGHRNLLVFPTEHATLERTAWNRGRLDEYVRNEFIQACGEGQQVLLANKDCYKKKQEALATEAKKIDLDVDPQKFHSTFLSSLGDRRASRRTILKSLTSALIHSNKYASIASSTASWMCFKQPFFTELFALDVAAEIDDCKFLHIVRDPTARYCSAKARRTRQKEASGSKLGPINRLSYVEGHCVIDVVSSRLAQQNLERLGPDRYKVIRFEQLIESPKQILCEVLSWLSLEIDPSHVILPTRLGKTTDTRSRKKGDLKIDSSALDYHTQHAELTSWNERLIHDSLLSLLLNHARCKTTLPLIAAYLTPLPNSSIKNYLCQLQGLWRWLINDYEQAVESFITKAKTGDAAVSGAT